MPKKFFKICSSYSSIKKKNKKEKKRKKKSFFICVLSYEIIGASGLDYLKKKAG